MTTAGRGRRTARRSRWRIDQVERGEHGMPEYRKSAEAVSRLTPEQYRVTQQSGTEAPGSGELLDNQEPGIYVDIVSGEPLVRLVGQVRVGLRLAELHQADRAEPRQRAEAMPRTAWSAPKCARSRRQPSRPCLPRRSERPRRPALLHQFGFAALRPPRRYGSGRLRSLSRSSGGHLMNAKRQFSPAAASGACRI